MADVNWKKYDCSICLAVALMAAATASALVAIVLGSIGVGIVLQVILFLVVWAVLGWLADGFCAARNLKPATIDTTSHSVAGGRAEAPSQQPAEAEPAKIAAEKNAPAAQAAQTAESAAAQKAKHDAKAVAEAEAKAAAEATARAEAKAAEDAAARAAAEEAEAARRHAESESAAAEAPTGDDLDRDGDGVIEGTDEGTRPEALDGPRDGVADDLKRIKGIGPKLELLCNSLGFYHFDQIAGWSSDEIAWVDSNLEGFKGRVSRDEWVSQAKQLAEGGETEFSKRVDGGDVPSSQ